MEELTLILNASEKRLQFLLLQDNQLLYAEESEPQKNGSDCLLPHIKNACGELGFLPSQIKKIASCTGPGNFMGIRITATIAAALSRANGGLQAGFGYMQALANNFYAEEGKILHIATAGTRDLVHSQCFRQTNGKAEPVTELTLISHAQLADIPCDYCCGSGMRTEKAQNALKNHSALILPQNFDSPSINSLMLCAENCVWQKQDVSPIYLKECDAIQNLPHIAAQQGRNPEQSRQELERLLKS